MRKKNRPRIFLIKDIEIIIRDAIEEMELINSEIVTIDKEYQLKSLMTYIFARYESALSDSLVEYLIAFPEKIDISKLKIKDELESLSSQSLSTEFKRSLAESYVSSLFFKDLSAIHETIEVKMSVCINTKVTVNKLKEKKATRNLIVHNNLCVNSAYINAAGNNARSDKIGNKLKIEPIYIQETLRICIESLELLLEQLMEKYSNYTPLYLLKTLWDYLFDSPILNFSDYWIHDEKEILGCNIEYVSKRARSLSSYEKTLLAIWIQQFNSSICQEAFNYNELQLWAPVTDEVSLMTEMIHRYPYIFYGKDKQQSYPSFRTRH